MNIQGKKEDLKFSKSELLQCLMAIRFPYFDLEASNILNVFNVNSSNNRYDYFNVLLNKNFPRFVNKKDALLAKSILYKRKFEYVKKNIYNLTDPEVETGKKRFLKNYEKKSKPLIKKNNSLRKLYETKMINEKIILLKKNFYNC